MAVELSRLALSCGAERVETPADVLDQAVVFAPHPGRPLGIPQGCRRFPQHTIPLTVQTRPVVPLGIGQSASRLVPLGAARPRPRGTGALDLQDLLDRRIRLDAGHPAEPGQLVRERLQLRLLPLVPRAAQARRILDRLLGVPVWDQERPLAHVLCIVRHVLRLDAVRHTL